MQPRRFTFPLLAPLAAVLLALALLVIVPAAARASGVETGPQNIAVDSSGDVYVSDWAHQTVDEITPQGVSIVAGIPGHSGAPTPGPAADSRLYEPEGLAVSKNGDLYINDKGNDVIEKVTPSGTLSIVAGEVGKSGTPTPGPATSSMLAAPIGIAVDSEENLYLADQGTQEGPNNVVEEVTPSGTLSIFAGELAQSGEPTPGPATDSMLNYPQAVAVDGAGNVYIADTANGVVEKVDTEGILSIYASSYFPQGVAANESGEVYVVGNGNTVDKVEPGGQLSRIAGDGQAGEPTPGPATRSMLDQPNAVAVDSAGNVYIADSGNDMAEKVTPAGELSIIWSAEDPIPGSTLTVTRAGSGSGTVTSSPSGITCAKTCFAGYEPDTPVTLTATPKPGSAFVGWEGSGCSGTGTCQVTLSSDMAVTATFQPLPPVTLTVALTGSGSGSVESSPDGIACPGTCSHAYEPDLPVTLTATPAAGSRFVGWEGSGCSGTGTCQVTLGSDMAVTATFQPLPPVTLTVALAGSGSGSVESSPDGIACPGTCSHAYEPDLPVTLTATPAAGSRFVGWEGSGCSGTGTCQVTLGSDATVTAMFEKLPVLSVSLAGSGAGSVESSPSGIACPGTCSHAYEPDLPVTLTATPAAGSRFVGWEGSGCSGTGTCQVTLSSDMAVTATFQPLPPVTLTVALAGSGSGSVESSPSGIACPGACSHAYEPDAQVTLTATPAAGSRFLGWEGSGCSGTGTCQVTMSSDMAVTATFQPLPPVTLTVALAGSGSGSVSSSPSGIACPGACSHAYEPDLPVTLTATPAAGSRFVGWEGSGCSGTGTCQVTLSSDATVTAMFEKLLLATPFESAPALSQVKLASKLLTARKGASLQFVVLASRNDRGPDRAERQRSRAEACMQAVGQEG